MTANVRSTTGFHKLDLRAQARNIRCWRARATWQTAMAVESCRTMGYGPCAWRWRWRISASRARSSTLYRFVASTNLLYPPSLGTLADDRSVGQPTLGAPDYDRQHLDRTHDGDPPCGSRGRGLACNRYVQLEQCVGSIYLLLDEHRTLQSMSRSCMTTPTRVAPCSSIFAGKRVYKYSASLPNPRTGRIPLSGVGSHAKEWGTADVVT
jgi:hypothetical protein